MSLLDAEDLAENNATRVPVVFCLDTSGSMQGNKIKKLNAAVKDFYEALLDDRRAKYAADVCVITFDNAVAIYRDFENVSHNNIPQVDFTPRGATELGKGVKRSLDCLEDRVETYKSNGLQCQPPMLIIMTDGVPNEADPNSTASAASRTIALERSGDLVVIPFFVGDARDDSAVSIVGSFSNVNSALSVKPNELSKLFKWISSKVVASSHAAPGSGPEIRIQDYLDGMIGQSGIDGLFK